MTKQKKHRTKKSKIKLNFKKNISNRKTKSNKPKLKKINT